MTTPTYIFDATGENFPDLVMENSRKGLVLVNFWAPWAGPCLKLWPILEKLAHDYQGRFLLVNINTDTHKQLARAQGINSLPSLRLYHRGKVLEQVYGVESADSLRRLLERHLHSPLDALHVDTLRALRAGDTEQALSGYARLSELYPQVGRIAVERAKLLLRCTQPDEAERVLAALPTSQRDEGEAGVLLTHIGFMRVVADASPRCELETQVRQTPTDLYARHQLAARCLLEDDYADALAQLLAILRDDRHYGDDVGRRGMLAIFTLLGAEHVLVRQYRTLLRNALS